MRKRPDRVGRAIIHRQDGHLQFDLQRARQELANAVCLGGIDQASKSKIGNEIVRSAIAVREAKLAQLGEAWLRQSKTARHPNFDRVTTADLTSMAELYDHLFFENRCLPLAKKFGLDFRWSRRMTSAGGKTTRRQWPARNGQPARTEFEIALSLSLLFQSFQNPGERVDVCGRICRNRMEAMQRIMEHELIHLTEMLVWTESNCAEGRFQGIASRLFGHTKHKHELITQRERASKSYDIRLGSRVRFRFDHGHLEGVVNRITRRATVLVNDPQGTLFSNGQRYRKFYVPIALLEPIEG